MQPPSNWMLCKIVNNSNRPEDRRSQFQFFTHRNGWHSKLFCGVAMSWVLARFIRSTKTIHHDEFLNGFFLRSHNKRAALTTPKINGSLRSAIARPACDFDMLHSSAFHLNRPIKQSNVYDYWTQFSSSLSCINCIWLSQSLNGNRLTTDSFSITSRITRKTISHESNKKVNVITCK